MSTLCPDCDATYGGGFKKNRDGEYVPAIAHAVTCPRIHVQSKESALLLKEKFNV